MAVTVLADLINPEVISAYLDQKIVDRIKFSPLAVVNTDLQQGAGNTLTIPTWQYIGDAADVAEGVSDTAVTLTATSSTVTVKKAVKTVDITDEALIGGYDGSDSIMAEIENQLATSIAQKVDDDCLTALSTVAEAMTADYTTNDESGYTQGRTPSVLTKEVISEAVLEYFGEDADQECYIFIAPAQLNELRTDPDFVHIMNGEVVIQGQIGQIYGVNVVVTNKIVVQTGTATYYNNYIIRSGALGIALKKETQVEMDRDIKAKISTISTDRHYAAYLRDAQKAIKLFVNA